MQDTAKLVYQHARRLKEQGKIPEFLGIKGLVALMYNDIVQHGETHNTDHLLDLAAHSLCALHMSLPDIVTDNEVGDIDDESPIENVEEEGREWKPAPNSKKTGNT